ncbi:3-oxoacyl-ACP reductase FabG [Pseudoalteromonas sp. SR43-6]|uniref:3-oxoacyl-ACP reductase FabG n=1 Tax=Pseudoalteromonas TaxID=53246 RepID=UPI00020A0F01|nr:MULTISPECIES: 3-oxoacyl-ACP reductase FabG [Pseudoalteromonas]EGI74424.1 3-oxoacyl-[acyl-carrier protein] reductase, inferred for ABFAE pathway [Pseudoalteromonas distincta]MBB1288416.1 3-oxoacyl-ACP reductase FabG [Pseudoalteromonas sp. SR41-5]MBB1328471.1 3-oxoacyl-ACP reductase FabG [Pseudoalteromonas sp. SR43-7]MBB1339659.1 3-oxoacyl-ACP reductase FabG [Pseudoalteromonas sp. SR44-2]MBB1374554.1 3-oxoacyl-ACP reductase FabG [Pseudoalteromonas sp. SR43-6]
MTKRILVTGSSRGIGKAIALKLAEQGFDIAVHCRAGVEQAQVTCDEINALGRATSLLQFDVCDREQAKAQIIEDIAKHGAYYGVVCNAGITNDMAFPAMQGEDWDCVIRTGLDGFYNVVHPTVMPMVQSRKGGRIITMSSVSGIAGNRGQVNYSAAKAGIIGATKALALELAKRKITVNCVAPGLIETAMTDELPIDEMMKMIPLKRMGSVKEVAGTVAFLMSDDAAYITRQVISVNGGMV